MEKTIEGVTYKYTESIFGPKIMEYVSLGGNTKPVNSAEYKLDEEICSMDQFN